MERERKEIDRDIERKKRRGRDGKRGRIKVVFSRLNLTLFEASD